MDDTEFQSKYPNIHFITAKYLQDDEQKFNHAKQNIQRLYENLPEEQRIILNQLGLIIELGQGRNCVRRYSKNIPQRIHMDIMNISPHYMQLDTELFSRFDYESEPVQNDWQRKAQFTFNEEATHAATMRLCSRPEWMRAVSEELKHPSELRNRLLGGHRLCSGVVMENGSMIAKAPLEEYKERVWTQKYPVSELDELSYEWPTEIIHCRNLLNTARHSDCQALYKREDINKILGKLSRYYEGATEEVKDAITEIVLTNAFPQTYPILCDYEQRLRQEAEGIKKEPASYPVLLDLNLKDHIQMIRHKRESKWNVAFKDFLSQSQQSK